MIEPERIKVLNTRPSAKGRYVVYWMQASQRAEANQALEYAVVRANELRRPLVVFFGLTGRFPGANVRHYAFMLEGLREVRRSLAERGIAFVVRHVSPEKGVVELARPASLVVVDRGYLRVQTAWRRTAARHLDCPLVQVEGDVVVPVEEASTREEYSAATIRPKIRAKLERFLVPVRRRDPRLSSLSLDLDSLDIEDTDRVLAGLRLDRSVGRSPRFRGGATNARRWLGEFISGGLDRFADLRNDPAADHVSHLSPYLHFGQVSPLDVALRVLKTGSRGAGPFLEELIIRRELSMNLAFFNPSYDTYEGVLPAWARKTLEAHRRDRRPYVYSLEELETGRTHDPYWNAAQKEMVVTGKMHGYMRMYWGKKILEWGRTPEEAFGTALTLNNKYELDGRDPNGFAGVAWCFGKHDRPWGERPVFGNVRYMNDKGLERKFDIDRYVRRVEGLAHPDQR